MKTHTTAFKQKICLFGKELDSVIAYTIDGVDYELGNEDLNSVNLHYKASILKSVMKQLDIDSNVEIPKGTVVNYQFGVKARKNTVVNYRDNYDYVDYGNYIVYSIEKQEDTNSYKIICYDKMIYSMIDYVNIGITYPITIRNYINTICGYLGLTFKNINDTFANYDKEIPNELYLDSDGKSLGYKFRDVLDELAQVTASTICINEEDDELEIRYITETNDTIDEEYLKDVNVNFGKIYGPVNTIVLSRSAESDNIYKSNPENIPDSEKIAIKIKDNQIMNGNNRADYLPAILNQLYGLEYCINDYSSTGICYYNLCDRYNVSIGETTYSCIMLNDDVNVTQGLQENTYTDELEESVTEYSKADKDDRKINQAWSIIDKVNGEIKSLVSRVQTVEINSEEQSEKTAQLETSVTQLQTDTYTKTEINQKLTDGSVTKVQTISGTFDENGMTYEKTNAPSKTTINEAGVGTKKNDGSNDYILFAGYVDDNNSQYADYKGQTIVATENIIVKKYLVVGTHSRFEDYDNGTGCFWIN